jgi:hypothetical protein
MVSVKMEELLLSLTTSDTKMLNPNSLLSRNVRGIRSLSSMRAVRLETRGRLLWRVRIWLLAMRDNRIEPRNAFGADDFGLVTKDAVMPPVNFCFSVEMTGK